MILTEDQRRTLDFIAAANRGGYRPKAAEIDQWRLNPLQKPGPRGELLEPARPGVILRSMTNQMSVTSGAIPNLAGLRLESSLPPLSGNFVSTWATTLKTLANIVGVPARYAPDGPSEKFLKHLRRLAWVEKDSLGGYALTPLSRALMRSDDQGDEESQTTVVVLGADDPLAYGHLIGTIASSGQCLVIDPYLRADGLKTILTNTEVSRVLVGPRLKKSEITELTVLVEAFDWGDRKIQIKRAGEGVLHDRYIVGSDEVYSVGSSFNSVGKSTATTITPLGQVADHLRALAEHWWHEADHLASSVKTQSGIVDNSLSELGSAIWEESGHFRHGRCQMRHRTAQAAERCRYT